MAKSGAGYSFDKTKVFQSPFAHLRMNYPEAYKRLVTLQEKKDAPPPGLEAHICKQASEPNLRLPPVEARNHKRPGSASGPGNSANAETVEALLCGTGKTVQETRAALRGEGGKRGRSSPAASERASGSGRASEKASGSGRASERVSDSGRPLQDPAVSVAVQTKDAERSERAAAWAALEGTKTKRKKQKKGMTEQQVVKEFRRRRAFSGQNPFGSLYEGNDTDHKICVGYITGRAGLD